MGLKRFSQSLLICLIFFPAFLVSCEKYSPESPSKPVRPGSDTIAVDTSRTQEPDSVASVISVGMALTYAAMTVTDTAFTPPEFYGIAGYIVGDVEGLRISSARFSPPFSSQSNILIADSPTETNVDRCMPVQLKSSTQERDELNLRDRPENLGRRIVVSGVVAYYFNVFGIKPLYSYFQADTPGDTSSSLRISDEEELIEGGR